MAPTYAASPTAHATMATRSVAVAGRPKLVPLLLPLLLFLPTLSRAQPPALWDTPTHDIVASWTFDPARAEPRGPAPQQRLVEASLRAVLAGGLIDDPEAARIVSGILAATTISAAPHRLVILDYAAEPDPDGQPGDWRFTDLAAVLEVRTGQNHQSLIRSIAAILIDAENALDERPGQPRQRTIRLPGDLEGVAFTREGWPPWRQVSWCSAPGVFYVALGQGALGRWLQPAPAPDPARGGPADLPHHRAATGRAPNCPGRAAELYLNIDRLRLGFPGSFARGRMGDLFDGWSLGNARSFALHAAWIRPEDVQIRGRPDAEYPGPPLLAIDCTWSARSDPPGTIHRLPVAAGDWPDLSFDPPPGSYAVVFEADWPRLAEVAVESYIDSRNPRRTEELRTRYTRWRWTHGPRMDRLLGSLGPWLILADSPRAPVPGLGTVIAPTRPGTRPDLLEADMRSLMAAIGDPVAHDPAGRLWTLRLLPPEADPGGLLRVLAWGFARTDRGPIAIGSWSPPAVQITRDRLER